VNRDVKTVAMVDSHEVVGRLCVAILKILQDEAESVPFGDAVFVGVVSHLGCGCMPTKVRVGCGFVGLSVQLVVRLWRGLKRKGGPYMYNFSPGLVNPKESARVLCT